MRRQGLLPRAVRREGKVGTEAGARAAAVGRRKGSCATGGRNEAKQGIPRSGGMGPLPKGEGMKVCRHVLGKHGSPVKSCIVL